MHPPPTKMCLGMMQKQWILLLSKTRWWIKRKSKRVVSVCLREKQKKVQNKKIPTAEVGTRTLNDVSFNWCFCAFIFLTGQKTALPGKKKKHREQGGDSYFLGTEPTTKSLFPEWLKTSSSCCKRNDRGGRLNQLLRRGLCLYERSVGICRD